MKKLLFALLVLAALPVDAANTLFWRCEGTTLDATHDHSAGDTTATAVSSIAVDATAVRFGTNGCNAAISGDDYFSFTATSIVSTTEGAAGFKINPQTWGADTGVLAMYNTGAPSDQIVVTLTGTDEVRLRFRVNGGNNDTAETTAANLVTSTWYGIVVRWDTAANLIRVEVYNDAGTLIQGVTNSGSTIDPQAAINEINFGDTDSTGRHYLDNLVIGDDYDDPVQTWINYTSYTEIGGGGGGGGLLLRRRRN